MTSIYVYLVAIAYSELQNYINIWGKQVIVIKNSESW